jgi:hypothetical protein
MKRLAGGLALLIACGSALATTDNSKTINLLGVQGSGTGAQVYFSVVEGFSLDCAFSNIYVDITTDFGRGAYAQLLVAKNSGRQLSRIDYTQTGGPGTECVLSLVEVGN